MNLSELRQRTKELIHKIPTDPDDDTGRPKNSELNAMLNEAWYLIYTELAVWFPQRFGNITTQQYGANATSLSMDGNVIGAQIASVYFTFGTDVYQYRLQAVAMSEFQNYSEYGQPQVYAVMGENIYLRPIPTRNVSLKYVHLTLPNEMGDADEPAGLPAMFHHAIAYKAALKWLKSTNDPANGLQDEMNQIMDQMQRYFDKLVPDNRIHEVEQSTYWNWI